MSIYLPESTLNEDLTDLSVPNDLEIPQWTGNVKHFARYWRSLSIMQAIGLATVAHKHNLTPDQFARVYLRSGKSVTLTPAR